MQFFRIGFVCKKSVLRTAYRFSTLTHLVQGRIQDFPLKESDLALFHNLFPVFFLSDTYFMD